MNDAKISAAVEACLTEAIGQGEQHPFLRVKAFLDGLRADPDWTDAQVMEVQTNVIRELINRLSRDELAGLPSNQ